MNSFLRRLLILYLVIANSCVGIKSGSGLTKETGDSEYFLACVNKLQVLSRTLQ
jgi:hypothetical protein